MPAHAADRDRGVVPDHLRGDLRDDLGDDRVHLAGHDRAALLELGQEDLGEAGARPGAHQAKVVRDLRERDGDDLERARRLDETVASRLRLEVVGGRGDGEPGVGGEVVAHACGELRMRVQPRPGGRAAERDLAEARHGVLDPSDPLPDLRRIAGELLAERHGHGVHEVRAPGLHDVVELHRLPLERRREQPERGQEIVRELPERSQVHGRREDVVRRLAHVHVVVRVNALAGDRRR